jgi:hypothetical protein
LTSNNQKEVNNYIWITLVTYIIIVILLGIGIFKLDEIKKASEPAPTPKIHIEPESLSFRLNGSDMIVKVIRVIFEDSPTYFKTEVEGRGFEKLISITKNNTIDNKEYSLYVNATLRADSKNSTLQGFLRLIYNLSDTQYEKKLPLEIFVKNKIKKQ